MTGTNPDISFDWFQGAPRFLQGYYAPTPSEDISRVSYDQGILNFFWDRLDNKMCWLKFMDDNNLQTWGDYPLDMDSLCYISVLPILGDKLGWCTSDIDPTPNEILPPVVFDGTWGILWWQRTTGKIFKLSSFIPNPDGGFIQTWTVIAS